MLTAAKNSIGFEAPNNSVLRQLELIKDRLLQLKMEEHDSLDCHERQLWHAFYKYEISKSEQKGRKFDNINFRRRVDILGITSAAIESVINFQTKKSVKLKKVCFEPVILKNEHIFGKHLCDVASKNIQIKSLHDELLGGIDDE